MDDKGLKDNKNSINPEEKAGADKPSFCIGVGNDGLNFANLTLENGKKDIKALDLVELKALMSEMKQPAFRAQQIFKWLHKECAESFDEMTNLPLTLRKQLDDNFVIISAAIEKKLISEYDNTVKYLFRLFDGQCIESVLMQYKYGYSLCVSTQAGCKMGCAFCASTKNGCVRNLSASEILSQVYVAARDTGVRISHIVLMGIGEPLDNYDNVIKFIRLITSPDGHNLSVRNITLSTCGVVPGIYALIKEQLPITLSVSLHASNDEKRSAIMPVNRKWPIREVIKASKAYYEATGRRISFEYALVKGVNDTKTDADELAVLLKDLNCHINLIPVNEIDKSELKAPNKENVRSFQDYLSQKGLNVTVRRTLGSDINASCGQLRSSVSTEVE